MKIKYLVLLALLISASPLSAQTLLWAHHEWSEGAVRDITMDNDANVYVTGYSLYGSRHVITTVKYNVNAQVKEWRRRHTELPNNGSGMSICLDDEGNVYVVGYTTDPGDDYDMRVIKYDGENGNIEWSKQEYQEELTFYGFHCATDDQQRLLVATDTVVGGDAQPKLYCYNTANGNLRWSWTYSDIDNGKHWVYGLAAYYDYFYYVYVGGTYKQPSDALPEGMYVYKRYYDDYGCYWVWDTTYGYGQDLGCDYIDIDNGGNVYLGGTKGGTKLAAERISADGTPSNDPYTYHLWSAPTGHGKKCIAVHRPSGNSYMFGYRWSVDSIKTFALNADCEDTIWTRDYYIVDYDGHAHGEIDVTSGCVYLNSYQYNNTTEQYDMLLLCYYRSDGTLMWDVTYNAGDSSKASDIAVTKIGRYTYIASAGNRNYDDGWVTLLYRYREVHIPDRSNNEEAEATQPFIAETLHRNPTNDILLLRFNSAVDCQAEIRIYTAAGRLVETIFSDKVWKGMNEITYETKNLPNGVYFLMIDAKNGLQTTKKFVIVQ